MNDSSTLKSEDALPWWRFGIVWMVWGGPALVVVAACLTAVIAVRGQDPVLTENIAKTPRNEASSTAPALQARNHAATAKP